MIRRLSPCLISVWCNYPLTRLTVRLLYSVNRLIGRFNRGEYFSTGKSQESLALPDHHQSPRQEILDPAEFVLSSSGARGTFGASKVAWKWWEERHGMDHAAFCWRRQSRCAICHCRREAKRSCRDYAYDIYASSWWWIFFASKVRALCLLSSLLGSDWVEFLIATSRKFPVSDSALSIFKFKKESIKKPARMDMAAYLAYVKNQIEARGITTMKESVQREVFYHLQELTTSVVMKPSTLVVLSEFTRYFVDFRDVVKDTCLNVIAKDLDEISDELLDAALVSIKNLCGIFIIVWRGWSSRSRQERTSLQFRVWSCCSVTAGCCYRNRAFGIVVPQGSCWFRRTRQSSSARPAEQFHHLVQQVLNKEENVSLVCL